MPFDALRSAASSAVSSSPEALRSSAPVAIFDSGLGGLSVLRAVRAALPDERLIYVADSLYAPYGERDDDFIADRTLAIGEWLVSQGAKTLVVACNTATSQSRHQASGAHVANARGGRTGNSRHVTQRALSSAG
jgi:glutamate racemase